MTYSRHGTFNQSPGGFDMLTGKLIAIAIVAITAIALQSGPAGAQSKTPKASKSMIEHGRYLVVLAGCNDCHSPKVMTPMGPMPDTTRLLSGHPATVKLPAYPDSILGMTRDKWLAVTSTDLTAW